MKYLILFVTCSLVPNLSALQKCCFTCFGTKEKDLKKKVDAQTALSPFYRQLLESNNAKQQRKDFLSPLVFMRGIELETIIEEDDECCEFEALLSDKPWRQEIK